MSCPGPDLGCCAPGPYVRPGVVWSRTSREVCVLGLDGALTFFSVKGEDDSPLFVGIGGWMAHSKPMRSARRLIMVTLGGAIWSVEHIAAPSNHRAPRVAGPAAGGRGAVVGVDGLPQQRGRHPPADPRGRAGHVPFRGALVQPPPARQGQGRWSRNGFSVRLHCSANRSASSAFETPGRPSSTMSSRQHNT
jgi:hypothetical protein